MKKIILINNDAYYYEAKYIISKNKYAIYTYNKINHYKFLSFYTKKKKHRYCNIGPQYRNIYSIKYIENGKFHNLYGPAIIGNVSKCKTYWINGKEYGYNSFEKYVSIYNNLSYKRTY